MDGAALDARDLARQLGGQPSEIQALLAELGGRQVFSRVGDAMPDDVAALIPTDAPKGVIVSRRMLRDEARSDEGRQWIEKRWRADREPLSHPNREPIRQPFTQIPESRLQIKKKDGHAASPQRPKRDSNNLDGFDRFWAEYPLKVKRARAEKTWPKALAAAGSVDVILAGLDRYKRAKPDWQAWAHPASWLNDGRWNDADGASDGPPSMNETERAKLHAEVEKREQCTICRGSGGVSLRYGERHGHLVGKTVTTKCQHDADRLREFCVRGGYVWPDDPGETATANAAAAPGARQAPMLLPIAGGADLAGDPWKIPLFLDRRRRGAS